MNRLTFKRIKQVFYFGWKDSRFIAAAGTHNRLKVYFDILKMFFLYHTSSMQYRNNGLWKLEIDKKEELAKSLGKESERRDKWVLDNFKNRSFLSKYSKKKYENSSSLFLKRNRAYTRHFSAGAGFNVQYNVFLCREHYLDGTISIGNNVVLAKNVFIDYSGHVVLGNNVTLSDGVAIESHEHPGYTNPSIDMHVAVQKDIIIEDGVTIGSKAFINASVGRIGRDARIGAGAVLIHSVPPYAIVTGNPAKIVGFSMTPEQVEAYEKDKYPEEQRISIDKYRKDYNKFFVGRMAEISKYIKK